MKKNIDFYRHETGAHRHWKFKQLRRKLGWDAEGRFWALNNMIADADDCLLHIDARGIKQEVAAELDMSVEELTQFIDVLADPDLDLIFKTDGHIGTDITQETLQGVMGNRQYQREWKRNKLNVDNKKLIIDNENSSIENSGSNIENEQTKVNKTKRKKIDSDGYSPPSKPPSATEVKIQRRQEREKEFYEQLTAYLKDYGREMLRKFYDYWSEPNKSGSKMKWEMERTWDLSRRLNTWRENDDKWSANKVKNQSQNEETTGTDKRILEKIERNASQ